MTAFAIKNDDKPVRLRVLSGSFHSSTVPDPVDVIFYDNDTPKTNEYRVHLGKGHQIKLNMIDGERWAAPDKLLGVEGPFIVVRGLKMEGPLFDQWPPIGHQLILGKRDANNLQDSEVPTILAQFAPRLFRRPVQQAIVDEFASFYSTLREENVPEVEAFKLTIQAMLVSPWFLYHLEPGDKPDNYAVANRLAYFLWRSTPDDELFSLAANGSLSSSDVLSAQVERLLKDEKGKRFLKDFSGQWLRIDEVGEIQPDSKLYGEYDTELETSMVGETEAFIREMLTEDLPLNHLIKSDWAMLNSRMARHYGLEKLLPEPGNHFRKVTIDPDRTRRGGLLTQASILNVTSNGTVTSPVVRGSWILENLLGTPPPPPPPDVPAIEPDIRGATTVKQQLAKHREIAQCASCHRKIDPYGMALENFDVIGSWREKYRGLQPTGNPNYPRLVEGNDVEMSDRLPRLGEFFDLETYRNLLLNREALLYENMTHKLATFALGRKMDFADQTELRRVAHSAMQKKAGMRTIIHELVKSKLFFKP